MNILITAGGTTEKIDDVRKITNSGTGRLGATVADCFANYSSVKKIYYICSEKAIIPDNKKTKVLIADDTIALEKVVRDLCENTKIDVVVHSMAVSDYRVRTVTTAETMAKHISEVLSKEDKKTGTKGKTQNIEELLTQAIIDAPSIVKKRSSSKSNKISSDNENLIITMESTPKIISLFRGYLPDAIIFGFKLLVDVEDPMLIDVAYKLLKKNDCDYVVSNDLRSTGKDSHIAHIVSEDKRYNTFIGKDKIAEAICDITLSAKKSKDKSSKKK